MFGYAGKMLRVDLTAGKTRDEELKEDECRKLFGGRALGAKILFEELKPGVDPLGAENKLIFATGPCCGAPFSGNAKYAAIAKSPLTGGYGEGMASGFFGPELKFAGYDAIVVEGRSEDPVYLWIHDNEAEIQGAKHLWGKITGDVVKQVRSELKDDKVQMALIGPGGENLVRYACIMSLCMNEVSEANGRCGTGAVMGSKKLKAVAVRGTGKLKWKDEAKVKELGVKAKDEAWKGWGENLNKYGTDASLDDLSASGRLPTQNFRRGTFEGADKITGETVASTILIRKNHCYACGVGCKRVVQTKEPYEVDPLYGGPEYETCAAFGSFLMNDNLAGISKANELCNKYSLDTISTGVTIAFAMECYEKGILTSRDTDGLDLGWGNHQAIVRLVEKIGERDGVGNLLAEGVKRAAKKIGRGAEKYAMHVKGLELPMHEPRGKVGMGLSYATSIRGGCHTQVPHDDYWGEGVEPPLFVERPKFYLIPEMGLDTSMLRHRLYTGPEKSKLVVIGQNWWSFTKCMTTCLFTPYPAGMYMSTVMGLINSVTGWDISPKEAVTVGERAWNLCWAFNVREGMSRKDDVLPDRMSEPLPDGLYKGQRISKVTLEKMKDHYYECRGWDKKTGYPTRAKLEELGLKKVADELQKLRKVR